jgi:hypothetical protein
MFLFSIDCLQRQEFIASKFQFQLARKILFKEQKLNFINLTYYVKPPHHCFVSLFHTESINLLNLNVANVFFFASYLQNSIIIIAEYKKVFL